MHENKTIEELEELSPEELNRILLDSASDDTLTEKYLKTLLYFGASPDNYTYRGGIAPFHILVNDGNYDVVKHLIEYGMDVDIKTDYGTTSLHYAANRLNKIMIGLLIASGANIHAKDFGGRTPWDLTCGRTEFRRYVPELNPND